MSMFIKLFGKKDEPVISTQIALQKLQEQEDMLLKKHDYLQSKVEAELATAKAHGTKNKTLALRALKQKKQFEEKMSQVDRMLNSIQEQRSSLENASMNSEILQVMSQSSKALKAAHKQMNADQVHDLMDDIAEQREIAGEIANAIAPPISAGVDDDELLNELKALSEDDFEKELLDIEGTSKQEDVVAQLPEAPKHALSNTARAKSNKQEEDDLAELQAWADA